MHRPVSPTPSGLLQQQPQRYSDRHLQQTFNSAKKHTLPPLAAHIEDGLENSSHSGDATLISKQDDQRIKLYLKKTHPTEPAGEAKPNVNKQVEELKGSEKESL